MNAPLFHSFPGFSTYYQNQDRQICSATRTIYKVPCRMAIDQMIRQDDARVKTLILVTEGNLVCILVE